jgi:hypothetical protein
MKRRELSRLIDLNSILKWLNILFCFLFIFIFLEKGPTEYVNNYTIILGVLLSFQIGVFLFFEKRRRDPFLLLLCFQMVVYFILRIVSLSLDFYSVVFERYPFKANNLNYAIIFILFANLALYAGLSLNNLKLYKNYSIIEIKSSPIKTYIVVIVLFIGYIIGLSGTLGFVAIDAFFNILSGLFVKLSVILFMILVYLLVFKNKLSKTTFNLLLIGLILFILIQTLTGSRSAILTIVNYCIFSVLAIYGCIKIKKWTIVGFIVLIPLMISFFLFATFLRPRLQEKRTVIGAETFEILGEFNVLQTIKEDAHFVLAPIFDRIGFLDYTAETIANSDKYKSILSIQYFFKSIIDNVFTPGFDVFDVPLESNAMRFIYLSDFGPPLKSKVTSESYQSDEFTFYGEFYVMFGNWFSLIPIFFIGFIVKRIYLKINDKYEYFAILKKGIVIAIFYTLLNSFGIDWLMLDLLGFIFTYKIFKLFFKFSQPIPIKN